MTNIQVRWRNFRNFSDTGWIDLPPLTILLGANNSGKSSIMLPWLLFKQTMESRDESTALIGRGEAADVGSYRDYVKDHDVDRHVNLDIRLHHHSVKHDDENIKHLGHHPPGVLELEFAQSPDERTAQLHRYGLRDIFGRRFFTRRWTGQRYSLRGLAKVVSAIESADESSTSHADGSDKELRKAIEEQEPTNFAFTGFSAWVAAQSLRKNSVEDLLRPTQFSSTYMSACDHVWARMQGLVQSLIHVGPMREPPKRIYDLSGEREFTIKKTGARTAELLYMHRDDELVEGVEDWLSKFGYDGQLHFRDLGNAAFSLWLRNKDGSEMNVADGGFGFSQLLPILVQGLAGRIGSTTRTLFAEQPEIHLNPALQVLLADFFIEQLSHGQHVVIETHSEHLVLRLRRLIAEGLVDASDVALYFVERQADGSSVRRIPLADNGHVDAQEWPSGFFSEGLTESLGLARAQASRGK